MTERLRIAVIGYGTAGQAVSILLTRDGHEVEIFERVPTPGPVGAGFLLQPSGLQVLWQMGLLDAVRAHAAPVHRLYGDTPCERAVMDMRYDGLDARLHGWVCSVGRCSRCWTRRAQGQAICMRASPSLPWMPSRAACATAKGACMARSTWWWPPMARLYAAQHHCRRCRAGPRVSVGSAVVPVAG